jgi:molybdopterin synthase catalytic subunit
VTPSEPILDDWVALTGEPLDVQAAVDWVGVPGCGAVVVFSGLVRDHAEGTTGVTHIEYEAYGEQVVPRLGGLAAEMRRRWPDIGRIVLWHRDGAVQLSESSVVVAVSTPHRGEAFAAAQFGIDTLKSTVPIWKKEFWNGGSDWARASQHVTDLASSGPTAGPTAGPSSEAVGEGVS